MPYVDLDHWSLYYECEGHGPPLVFLAGTATDHRSRSPVLEELRRTFTVLSLDQRGIGRSGAPDVEVSTAEYADDVGRLAEHVGWDSYACFGASFGGMVAQFLAARRPSRVARLVLACTTSGGPGGKQLELSPAELEDPIAAAVRLHEFADLRATTSDGDADIERVMFERFEHVLDDEDRRTGLRRQLRARAGHDAWNELASITAATLVCGGRHDGVARPGRVLNLAERIPRSRIRMFEGGHFFMMQDPAAMPTIIRHLTEEEP
jgi:3-oxoadipate enol-lactonase